MKGTRRHARDRRHRRVRKRVRGTASRPRLAVYRSNKYIYAQVIDDIAGVTVAQASSREKAASGSLSVDTASRVGELLAARAKDAGVESVVFDRGGYHFHGRVKALADAAREAGLKF
jgi:large subunit ribosomal protein L18